MVMLRSKKFNLYKHKGLNYLFNFCTGLYDFDIDNINKEKYISNYMIKKTEHYELVKEIILEPYILILKNILLIHLTDNVIKEFEFLYKKSDKYVFDIYETQQSHLKKNYKIKMYHVFCVSEELSNDINYISFLKTNDSDKKYLCLSLFYGPCILINRRFDINCQQDKYKSKYKYLKTIGKGKVDNTLRISIKNIINMVNEYQNTLPPHYLKIN